MSDFSQSKFENLSLERKVKVTYDLVLEIESQWNDTEKRHKGLSKFRDYFQWFNFYQINDPALKNMGHLLHEISPDITLRRFLDIAVPFERFLDLSLKDDQIFEITYQDKPNEERETLPFCFVLDHLRSAFNVGSLFRTAECLGVEHIYLIGYTPTPLEKGVKKTAMGMDSQVSWSQHDRREDVFADLKEKGYTLVGLETVKDGVALYDFEAPRPLAVVAGNERFGLSRSTLEQLDVCVQIPMLGQKNSLNVANCLGIFSYEVIRQWRK